MNIIRYKIPVTLTFTILLVLLTFQHCGSGGGSGSETSEKLSSPVIVSDLFENDSYLIERTVEGETYIFKIDLLSNDQFVTHRYKYINNDFGKAYYQKSKGTYAFSGSKILKTITTESTCEDNNSEEFEFEGVPGEYIALKRDSVQIKFISLKKSNTLKYQTTQILIDDTDCGQTEDTIDSTVKTTSLFYSSNPALSSNPQIDSQVQSIKANVACTNGYRLTNDVSFFLPGSFAAGSGSRTTIGGQFQEGFMSNGTISQLYVGVSLYRDLMFVTKVTNGSQVLGFNVTLSYCEVKNSYQGLPSIISNERPLKNFRAQSGIVLDTDTHCGYGVVDWAPNTVITSLRELSNPSSPPDVDVPVSFTKPTCNGQF